MGGTPKSAGGSGERKRGKRSRKVRSEREIEDRRLCPGNVNNLLGVGRRVIADAMREIGRTEPLSVSEVKSWKTDPAAASADGIAILAAAAAARAQSEHRRQQRELEAEHRELQLRAKVEQRLLRGARNFQNSDADFIASDMAFEAMKWLVRFDGDASQLSDLDLAALRWAGVDPARRDTWFLERGSDRRRRSSPPKQPASFVRDTVGRVWVTQPILRVRGWTDAGIRDYLPEPDGFKQNPYYSTAGAPMPAWLPETVAEAEASPQWQQWLQKSLRRRKTTLSRLIAAIEDDDFRRRVEAVQAAIDSYHRMQINRAEPPPPNERLTPMLFDWALCGWLVL